MSHSHWLSPTLNIMWGLTALPIYDRGILDSCLSPKKKKNVRHNEYDEMSGRQSWLEIRVDFAYKHLTIVTLHPCWVSFLFLLETGTLTFALCGFPKCWV